MEDGDGKQPLIVKEGKRQRFTSFKRRSYEVYSSFSEFVQVSDPTKREPERIKSLSFKRHRISVCVEGRRNASDTDLKNRSQGQVAQGIQVRLIRSQPDQCTSCKLSITHNDNLVIQLHEDLYHVYCFQCTQCGNKINPKVDYILIENGKPLCGSCIPECRACGETILSNHVHVIDKDFHEKCLLCTFCRKVIKSSNHVRNLWLQNMSFKHS